MLVGLFVIFVIAWHHPQHTVFGSGRIVDNVRGIKFQILADLQSLLSIVNREAGKPLAWLVSPNLLLDRLEAQTSLPSVCFESKARETAQYWDFKRYILFQKTQNRQLQSSVLFKDLLSIKSLGRFLSENFQFWADSCHMTWWGYNFEQKMVTLLSILNLVGLRKSKWASSITARLPPLCLSTPARSPAGEKYWKR